MPSQPRYRVSELARLGGVNPRTVDYYTTTGLLVPVMHSKGGHRFYDDAAVYQLRVIKALQAQGMPLAAIRARLAAGDEPDLLARVEALRADLQRLGGEVTVLAPQVLAGSTHLRKDLRVAVAGAVSSALIVAQALVDVLNQGGIGG